MVPIANRKFVVFSIAKNQRRLHSTSVVLFKSKNYRIRAINAVMTPIAQIGIIAYPAAARFLF
jgi:hypothetical protein